MLVDIIDFLRSIDEELYSYIQTYGVTIYVILFAIVFTKTAFVILTFLPGDSLVFASGTLAAISRLDFLVLFILYFVATSLGDSQNFFIGRTIQRVSARKRLLRLLPANAMSRAKQFLESYDRAAITFSRFVPLMRTMTPFIAGYTGFSYWKFVRFNVAGAFLWVTVWLGSGYVLGNIKWVEQNVMMTLLVISAFVLIPTAFAYFKQFQRQKIQQIK
ncbi:MAG: VTT domain-containing protein [Solibacillus sp.]